MHTLNLALRILSLKVLVFSILVFSQIIAQAEEDKTIWEKAKEKTSEAADYVQGKSKIAYEKTVELVNESVLKRNVVDYGVLVHYSYLDLIIPSKYGITFSKNSEDRNTQYEIQYLRGSISIPFIVEDLGSMTEQRLSLLKRNFSNTSNFNWFYGISYNKFDISLGVKYLNTLAPGQNVYNYELIDIQTLGLDLGFGHRWYYKNGLTIAVDWAAISQPLALLKKEAPYTEGSNSSNDNKDSVNTALKIISYFPRMSFFKLSLGYSF